MKRPVVGVIAGALLLVAPAPGFAVGVASAAAPASCDGKTATIVATGVPTATGTNGDDVIVATDVNEVDALAGDDTVCVDQTDGSGVIDTTVVAGTGDDDVVGHGQVVRALLGDGDDQYDGDSRFSFVAADGSGPQGHDVIAAENGSQVFSGSGRGHSVDDDVISGQRMSLQLRGRTAGSFTADHGNVIIRPHLGGQRVSVLLRQTGLMRIGRWSSSLHGFDDIDVSRLTHLTHLTYQGDRDDETLTLGSRNHGARGDVQIDMGAGDDTVVMGPVDGGTVNAGQGRDRLELSASSLRPTKVSLRTGHFRVGNLPSTGARNFEDLWLFSPVAHVVGSTGSDRIEIDSCRSDVSTGAGNDAVRLDDTIEHRCRQVAHGPSITHLGPGRDRARGSSHRDVIVGGRGVDSAHGGGGRDVCRVEHAEDC